MEQRVLFTLSWELCPPTAFSFARMLASFIPSEECDREELIEKLLPHIREVVINPEQMCSRPSRIAFTVMVNALKTIQELDQLVLAKLIRNFSMLLGISSFEEARILSSSADGISPHSVPCKRIVVHQSEVKYSECNQGTSKIDPQVTIEDYPIEEPSEMLINEVAEDTSLSSTVQLLSPAANSLGNSILDISSTIMARL